MNVSTLIENLTGLEPHLSSKIKGQGHVISRVSSVLERGQFGLQPTGKPLGSLLFLGPTGVGKTQLTLEFSRYLFGEGSVFRFDMSEFLHLDNVKLFMGDETGSPGRIARKAKCGSQSECSPLSRLHFMRTSLDKGSRGVVNRDWEYAWRPLIFRCRGYSD